MSQLFNIFPGKWLFGECCANARLHGCVASLLVSLFISLPPRVGFADDPCHDSPLFFLLRKVLSSPQVDLQTAPYAFTGHPPRGCGSIPNFTYKKLLRKHSPCNMCSLPWADGMSQQGCQALTFSIALRGGSTHARYLQCSLCSNNNLCSPFFVSCTILSVLISSKASISCWDSRRTYWGPAFLNRCNKGHCPDDEGVSVRSLCLRGESFLQKEVGRSSWPGCLPWVTSQRHLTLFQSFWRFLETFLTQLWWLGPIVFHCGAMCVLSVQPQWDLP